VLVAKLYDLEEHELSQIQIQYACAKRAWKEQCSRHYASINLSDMSFFCQVRGVETTAISIALKTGLKQRIVATEPVSATERWCENRTAR
jgi:hypothetical protein